MIDALCLLCGLVVCLLGLFLGSGGVCCFISVFVVWVVGFAYNALTFRGLSLLIEFELWSVDYCDC